eukprot:gnl/MRDRNA2_/MRDRNA2_96300_c0_seq1.p1 gnl/MRDRNA2_/MRDRNA2_96300_c0~~gnl/MRDRNA2_/MRDRNA2_96300_c0_seq1.p1  ORF type:complete len:400 (-),score=56.66 gnl/MRDRNA2_/MRDRNA2_96300_c0_seq1:54-1253(-)
MNIRHKISELKKAFSGNAPQFEQSYYLGERLGYGGFGAVHSCHSAGRADGGLAVKVFDRKSKSGLRRAFRTEVKLMQEVDAHDNCVQMLDAFEGPRYCHIVMELCGSTVLQALLHSAKCEREVTERDLACVFKGMLSGVQHLHKCCIVHRDIKPDNILLTSGNHLSSTSSVKICDLGLAAKLDPLRGGVRGMCGTVQYMAPEMLFKDAAYYCEVDLWSCGVTAYLMLLGEFPYEYSENTKSKPVEIRDIFVKPCDNKGVALVSTCNNKFKVTKFPTYRASNGFPQPSAAALKFLRSLLIRDPLARSSTRAMLCSEFIRQGMRETSELQPSLGPTLTSAHEASKSPAILELAPAPVTSIMMEELKQSANESTDCGSIALDNSDDEPQVAGASRCSTFISL